MNISRYLLSVFRIWPINLGLLFHYTTHTQREGGREGGREGEIRQLVGGNRIATELRDDCIAESAEPA